MHLDMKNPFSPTYPVDPQYFANRINVLSTFRRAIERSIKTKCPTPDNIAILGDWGVGKSSVLKKFEAIALEEFSPRKIFSSLIELIPVSCNSFASFSEKVIDDIDRNFITNASLISKVRNEIKKWRASSIGISPLSAERKIRTKSVATVFKEALIDLWKILEDTGVDTVIIMLDDLHYLAERCPDALYDIRGIFQGLPRHGCNFMLCCTGRKDLFLHIRELAEPLSRFFNIKHSLSLFSLDETKEIITKPLEKAGIKIQIENAVIENIFNLTIGHPFFVHLIMRELISLGTEKALTLETFNEIYPAIEEILSRDKFEVDYLSASAKEREVLRIVARIPKNVFMPHDIKVKNIRNYLRLLVNKNVVTKHERGEYSLYHPLFKEYLKQNPKDR